MRWKCVQEVLACNITLHGGPEEGIGRVVLPGEAVALERQQHARVDMVDQERFHAGSVSVDYTGDAESSNQWNGVTE